MHEVAVPNKSRELDLAKPRKERPRVVMGKVPRWLVSVPKVDGLPMIEGRRRQAVAAPRQPRLGASLIRRPSETWD